MRFLLDVHISMTIARVLLEQGHDVLRAAVAHGEWADEDLLAFAVEENRMIVTADSDFSDLVYAHSAPVPPAILYLRCKPQDQPKMARRLLDALEPDRIDRHMVVIRPSSIRYRPLPGTRKDNG